jgi:phenylalanyl-tRNA synthetase beta chain
MNVMRSKLWGSHIDALTYNLNRGQNNIRIFEIAPVYQKMKSDFKETLMLSGLVYGDNIPEQWGDDKREINFECQNKYHVNFVHIVTIEKSFSRRN